MNLEFPVLKNNHIHYFDYGATSFMPQCVMDKWNEINSKVGVSIGRGSSHLTKSAEKEMNQAENYLKEFFGLGSDYQNIYARNVTDAINIVGRALEDIIEPLDMIVVGPFEHHSNYLIWRELAKKRSALFCELPITPSGELDYDYIDRYKDRIKVISISAISNAFGYKLDIEKIASKISDNTIFLVDESQVVAHEPIKTNEKIAGYFIPSHKMYGPKNIAMACIKKSLINKMKPVMLGGGMVKSVGYNVEWLESNKKFHSGTMDISLLCAWAEACKFIKSITYDKIDKQNDNYSKIIKAELIENGYKVIQLNNNHANHIISFIHPNIHAHDINEYLSSKNIVIRSGNLCSQNTLRKIESTALNRISLGLGVTDDDVKNLCAELKKISKLTKLNIYSKKVNQLLELEDDAILIPDLILDKEGIACGDKVVLSGEIDNNIILFNFNYSLACDLTKLICKYLYKEYNNKPYEYIVKKVSALKQAIDDDNDVLFSMFDLDPQKYSHRFECMYDPIKLLLDFLTKLNETKYIFTQKPDTHYNMACDACTGACRINWNNEKVQATNRSLNTTFPKVYLQKWLPLGKIVLTNQDKENLKNFCKDMEKYDYAFLARHKINSIVFDHITKLCPESLNGNWKAAAYSIQKNEITNKQFEKILEHITNNKLDVYFIKGYASQKYYDNPYLRTHSDYDIIAKTSTDAFRLTSFLLQNGFTIRPNLFSIKNMNYKGEPVVTGHFHLQKILDDMYMFELDIAFPGYPINRVELYSPAVKNGKISTEDQIIITLLHLFKHSDVYIKDINDLYYMLNSDINLEYLNEKIQEYNLGEFLSLAIMYIKQEYPVDIEKFEKIISLFNLDKQILDKYPSWPYDNQMHLKIKKNDFEQRTNNNQEDDRKFLFPAVMFVENYDFGTIDFLNKNNKFKSKKILDDIYEITFEDYTFYLTSIGIFIDNYINTEKISRTGYIKVIEKFLKIIGKIDFYSVSYATKHFGIRVI